MHLEYAEKMMSMVRFEVITCINKSSSGRHCNENVKYRGQLSICKAEHILSEVFVWPLKGPFCL